MSRHHNTKHFERSGSNYEGRPGMMGTGGHLPAIEGNAGLRARQERRVKATCTVSEDHDHHACNGFPWPAYGVATVEGDE